VKEIKAYKVLLFVAGVLLILAPLVIFTPEGGWNIAGMKINFLNLEKFNHPKKQESADISAIIGDIDTSMTMIDDPLMTHKNGSNGNLGAPNGGHLNEDASTELQMNDAGKANLHAFFSTLESVASEKQKISILHYGDSQIEGDRMTSYIRQRIQDQFGGYGPGLIPATNVYSTISFKQRYSENFKRFTCFGGESLKSRKYGVMASAARFTKEFDIDSTFILDTIKEQTGWIEISPSGSAYDRARTYNNVTMHYNSCNYPVKVKVFQNGTLIHEEMLKQDGKQNTLKLNFGSTPGTLKYEFTGKVSPNICAFGLEGDYGVQVTNIGMRGSSGTIWGKMNQETLGSMYAKLNTKMVIMQFGGNSVPSFTDSSSVRNYASYFKGQIARVKSLNPGAMIVVIGPSDMSKFNEGIYETYPLLSYCVDKMKEVTINSGGAFWNLYAAMGGRNSMPSWVEKGLAGKDYIHFSNGGAKIASQLFYDALIAEFAKWKKQ
jgi:hypothetical protein